MSKGRTILLLVLAVVITAAIAAGVAGCANKSSTAPPASAPSVSTPSVSTPSVSTLSTTGTGSGQGRLNPQQMQANVKNAVAGLVSNGTITQSQSDAVVQAYAQASANRQPGSGQYNSGSPGSGSPGSGQTGSGQRQNRILAPLVTNGTLTQTQANVVSQAIRQTMPHRGQIPGGQVTTQTTTQ